MLSMEIAMALLLLGTAVSAQELQGMLFWHAQTLVRDLLDRAIQGLHMSTCGKLHLQMFYFVTLSSNLKTAWNPSCKD